MRPFRPEAGEVPRIVAIAPAAVAADVEATPVIDGGHSRRRLGVHLMADGEVRAECGRRRAKRNDARSHKQQVLFHLEFDSFRWPPGRARHNTVRVNCCHLSATPLWKAALFNSH
jgi:hypothetical protein